jgi:hypothetical protein
MSKRDRERAILRTVYNETEFERIEEGEEPDFVLHHKRGGAPFGVEVTELYASGTDARLKNIPGYSRTLMAGGRHEHRDDIGALRVSEVVVSTKDGQFLEHTKAVISKVPPVSGIQAMLADRLSRKGQDVSRYRSGLSHANLIVFDRTNRFIGMPREYLWHVLVNAELRELLANSPFREVSLVALLEDRKLLIAHLRMMLLLSELFMVCGAAVETAPALLAGDDTAGQLLAAVLKARSIPAVAVRAVDGKTEVRLGNWGIVMEAGEVDLRDYRDHPARPGDVVDLIVEQPEFLQEILSLTIAHEQTHLVESRVLFGALSEPLL